MVTAVFPAAGQGRRMNVGMNKVFLELAGKPILVHTLLRFSASSEIDNLVVVVAEEDVSSIRRLLSHVPGLKPFQVVAGSTERQYSIANGLAVVPEEADIVLVHDAARPLTSVATIDGVVQAARDVGGAVAAVPAKSTIKLVDEDGVVVKTPPRDKVWEVRRLIRRPKRTVSWEPTIPVWWSAWRHLSRWWPAITRTSRSRRRKIS